MAITLKEAEERPYTQSEVNYWLKGENGENDKQLISAGTMVPPSIGEIVHIETRMDKDWYDARYKKFKKNFFREGVTGFFKVISIKRWLEEHHYEVENCCVPFSRTTENFEVYVERVNE